MIPVTAYKYNQNLVNPSALKGISPKNRGEDAVVAA